MSATSARRVLDELRHQRALSAGAGDAGKDEGGPGAPRQEGSDRLRGGRDGDRHRQRQGRDPEGADRQAGRRSARRGHAGGPGAGGGQFGAQGGAGGGRGGESAGGAAGHDPGPGRISPMIALLLAADLVSTLKTVRQ